jgi:hypothetical protein
MTAALPDGLFGVSYGERAKISGTQILDGSNQPLYLQGVNFGSWGRYQPGDAALIKSWGANCVRLPLLRWWGEYGQASIEARDDLQSATSLIKPANIALSIDILQEVQAAGLWIIGFIDSNCGQNGLQPGAPAYCDIGNAYPVTGRNFWSDLAEREKFKNVWRYMAMLLRGVKRIAMFELCPEPLEGRDSTWAAPTRDFYRDIIAAVRPVDPFTQFLTGPRGAYDVDLIDEAWLPERGDVAVTGNWLNSVTTNTGPLAPRAKAMTDVRAARNVPVIVQQLGRNSSADPTLAYMRAGLSGCKNNGIHFTWWNMRDNGASAANYGLFYDPNNWTAKTTEIALLTSMFGRTPAQLESAAQAAATAAGGLLFYVRGDNANSFQDSAASVAANTIGQPLGRLNAVVGSGNFLQSTVSAERPLLAAAANGMGWSGDGVDDYLGLSANPFASGEDTTVIVAASMPAGNSVRVLFHAGTSGANVRYPYLAVQATDLPLASWRGDDAVAQDCTGAVARDNASYVFTASKIGANKRLLINGEQDGSTNTGAVSAVASFSRGRVGSNTAAGAYFPGVISLVYVGKTMTDTQRQDIERFGAYLAGAFYAA